MKLSVIIVNYNVRFYLAQCIESVLRASVGLDADVWVVDNASIDDSVAYVRRHFPQVNIIENRDNVGFSRANNQAIRQSRGEYVLLLNPDTIVTREAIHGAVALLDSHPRAGATGTMMLTHGGSFALESRRGIPTPATAFYKMVGLCSLFPRSRRFGRYYMQYLDRRKAAQIEVISGAFMLLRRSALDQVGLLDEDYFMYGEDIDLSYRVLSGGWENWYSPAPILHYKGESTKTNSWGYVINFYNAMLIFFNKQFGHRYRRVAPIVKLAVLARGTLQMFMSYSRRLLRNLHRCVLSLSHAFVPQPAERESLMFVGSDAAWEELLPLCRRSNLDAYRCRDLDEVAADSHTRKALYLTVPTDDSDEAYNRAISLLMQANERGLDLHLGTYSTKHHTLILPNDCFC